MSSSPRIYSESASVETYPPVLACLGNWQLVELLGEGRWSRVYRARPRCRSDRSPADYAVKLVNEPSSTNSSAVRLLRREAAVGRRVAHPHLTSILSSHVHRPPHYLVMPCLEGATLESLLGGGARMPTSLALFITRQVAAAIAALHRSGWIHSDVKPGNIFVSSDGHVTLLDLGLARRIGEAECAGSGPLAGTLAFTAPESYSSVGESGPASDVYSLGITLYRMLTGTLPFPETEAGRLVQAHLHHAPPDPRQFSRGLESEVVQLLKTMLAKQPARRPLGDALVLWLADLEGSRYSRRAAA
jgi:serine/threonine-protein kinase